MSARRTRTTDSTDATDRTPAPVARVVQVSGYYPPHVGGIEFCAQAISTELAVRGVPTTVLTSNSPGPRAEVPAGLLVRRLRAVTAAHTPFVPGLAAALLRTPRGAVVHLHLSHVFPEVVTAVVARVTRRRVVAHFHMDVAPSGPLGGFFTLYKKTVLGPVLRSAAHVVALSAEQRDLVVRRYGVRPDDVTVLPNGVGEEFFVADRPAPEPGAPLRVLFVGRLAQQKRLDRLVDVLEVLDRPFRLDVVGDGELREELQRTAGRLPGGTVHWWGALAGEALRERYRRADVFVLTSDREGMPLALLEAMAGRLPVVASDVQGLREFVGTAGLLGDPDDAEGFAALLRRLADDPDAWRAASDAAAEFADRHRWTTLVTRLQGIYDLVQGGAAGESGTRLTAPTGELPRQDRGSPLEATASRTHAS